MNVVAAGVTVSTSTCSISGAAIRTTSSITVLVGWLVEPQPPVGLDAQGHRGTLDGEQLDLGALGAQAFEGGVDAVVHVEWMELVNQQQVGEQLVTGKLPGHVRTPPLGVFHDPCERLAVEVDERLHRTQPSDTAGRVLP